MKILTNAILTNVYAHDNYKYRCLSETVLPYSRYSYDQEAADRLLEERGIVARHFSMTWGFIGFVVDADQIYMEYVDNNGQVIYTYTKTK